MPRRQRGRGWPEREGEQDEGEDREGDDLPQEDPRAQLDAEVLAATSIASRHMVRPLAVADRHDRSPPSSTTWFETLAARSGSWLVSSTVAPAVAACSMTPSHRSRAATSSPACGSSRSQSAGRRASSQARPILRDWPADSVRAGIEPSRPVRPTRSSADAASSTGRRMARSPKQRFSVAESAG